MFSAGSDALNTSRASQGSKRQRVSFDTSHHQQQPYDASFENGPYDNNDDERDDSNLVEETRSRSPLRVKRSTSLHFTPSFTSPKRTTDLYLEDPKYYSNLGRKLHRSLSLSELNGGTRSRKSLEFDHPLFGGGGGPAPLEASSLGCNSSAGSDVELNRHEEEPSFAKWTNETLAASLFRDSVSPSGFDEDYSPRVLSNFSNIAATTAHKIHPLPQSSSSSSDQADMVITDRMSTLEVSSMNNNNNSGGLGHFPTSLSSVMPPPPMFSTSVFAPSTAVRVLGGGGGPGAFETPTREQSILLHCNSIDVSKVVEECKRKIKLAVFDLDDTMLDVHTKGMWKATGKLLGERHLRPVFRVLIPALLKEGIPVGVATFSGQEAIIEELMRESFPSDARVEDNVFVRGSRLGDRHTSSQECLDDEDDDDTESGKRKHIKCILDRLPHGAGASIAPAEILFVDDDEGNTTAAQKDGHRTVRFQASWTDDLVLSRIMRVLVPM